MAPRRPAHLCRSWLFLEGANEAVLQRAAQSGADVLIQELEDFTPPKLRPQARALAGDLYASWRAAGAVVAVRVNPLDQDGMDDLAAVMRGRPDIVALPKVAEPHHVARLDQEVSRFERAYGIPEGSTALLPQHRVRPRPGADLRHCRRQPTHRRMPAGFRGSCRRSRRGTGQGRSGAGLLPAALHRRMPRR
jgi:hypothetical protein